MRSAVTPKRAGRATSGGEAGVDVAGHDAGYASSVLEPNLWAPGGLAVVYRKTHGVDAIDEYSRRLVDALGRAGYAATYTPDGLPAAGSAGDGPAWILLQYMPFSYGRWGFAPHLVHDAFRLKRASGAMLCVMVHEAWVAMDTWRTCVMGVYQRLQLRSLLLLADVIIVSTGYLRVALGRRAVHLPVGSTISPSALSRAEARYQLGLGDELVVTLFGTGNPHRVLEHPEAAITALTARRGAENLRIFNLGAGAAPVRVPPEVRVDTPGSLPADEISRHLRASDVLLLSFSDGISTRRTTLMAGLAHGVPVVGLSGISTDDVLKGHPEAVVLTPVGNPRAFTEAVLALTSDRQRLERTGQAGRALYDAHFDWSVIARRLTAVLEAARR